MFVFLQVKKKSFFARIYFCELQVLTINGLNSSYFGVMNEFTNGLNVTNLERIKPNHASSWTAYLTRNILFHLQRFNQNIFANHYSFLKKSDKAWSKTFQIMDTRGVIRYIHQSKVLWPLNPSHAHFLNMNLRN